MSNLTNAWYVIQSQSCRQRFRKAIIQPQQIKTSQTQARPMFSKKQTIFQNPSQPYPLHRDRGSHCIYTPETLDILVLGFRRGVYRSDTPKKGNGFRRPWINSIDLIGRGELNCNEINTPSPWQSYEKVGGKQSKSLIQIRVMNYF